jgi:hypothetical protein
MSIHTMRSCCGGALVVIPVIVLLGHVYAPRPGDFDLATVTGRVTFGGHPVIGISAIFLATDPHGYMTACPVRADGTFRMEPRDRTGLVPGTYRVCFVLDGPGAPDPRVAPRYQDPRASDLLVHVGPGWNDIALSLPEPGRVPPPARRR